MTTNLQDPLLEKLKDPVWRLEHLYFITDEKGDKVRFKLNHLQKILVRNLHWRVLILKARQLGMSTFIAIFFLDQILFHPNKMAAIVADKKENATKIFRKVEYAWQHFREDLKSYLGLQCTSDSASMMSFSNDSSIEVGTTIHSGTYQYLHLSEIGPLAAESPEKEEQVMKSALPTVHANPDTYVFIESTAEGEGNDFHARAVQAQESTERAKVVDKENPSRALSIMEYRFVFFAWWQNPKYAMSKEEASYTKIPTHLEMYFTELEERLKAGTHEITGFTPTEEFTFTHEQKAWYLYMDKELKGRMKEQYPSYPEEAFVSSGNKMFDADILRNKLKTDVREPFELDGNWKIFVPYMRGHRYAIGADVSMGVGGHHSTATVIDFDTLEVVATFMDNKIAPIPFAYELARVGNRYGSPLIAPEANSIGHTTVHKLAEIYPNVFRYHIEGMTESKETERLGWLTNVGTKGRMLYALKDILEEDENPLKVRDATILREAIAFKKEQVAETETIKRMKEQTAHSDLLIATAIAWQMNAYATTTHDGDSSRAEALVAERRLRNRSAA